MTWMPDREAVTRRRRRTSSSQQQHPEPHEYETYGRIGRQRETEAHPMGIPRILQRRARWVGARLRREE
ncbi:MULTISPECIES: hypothetical protein [unclassified Kitasatospora]|uniref:hypothetical protein n=1 Tax=unclassified Kitasatospora TaxID=2633591 RepID=UPI00070BF1CE|nr:MULTISPECIES: hypothetical protein [unclassified Kitasatospora]KQV18841.1 hypothetical protein ASC99_06570 [Kitasatospora sp. Root107]KRB74821.1 hypothetical protein ASE03_20500 [Kitasatospora sp. Root187]